VGACALACGSLGIAASGASGAGAGTGSVAGLMIPFGGSVQQIIEETGGRGVSVGAACPSWAQSDDLGLDFQSGNGVNYKPDDPGPNANAEGDAILWDFSADDGAGASTGYEGHAHVWIGTNVNPNAATGNLQAWSNQTVSFDGSDSDGDSISVSVSAGGGTSATGQQSGWVHVKVTCTSAG
jgi:hypothetical protein